MCPVPVVKNYINQHHQSYRLIVSLATIAALSVENTLPVWKQWCPKFKEVIFSALSSKNPKKKKWNAQEKERKRLETCFANSS